MEKVPASECFFGPGNPRASVCPRLYCGVSGSSMVHKVNGRTTLTAGNILDDQQWHYVTIKRYGRQVNFTVDSQTVTAICKGEFSHLDLDSQVILHSEGWES